MDLDQRLIRVRKAKGGRQRVVPIHPGLVPLFIAYAAARPIHAMLPCSSASTPGA